MSKIRKPTVKEVEKLDKSRELMVRGIEGEKDFLSKISTTMAKSARDDQKSAKKIRESVPESARDYEAYQGAGYKKGGVTRADGCVTKGHTKGKMVAMCGGGYMKKGK
jgi:hypothetical protein